MDKIYGTTYDEPLDKRLKFPVNRFSVPQKTLSETAQKLRFKFDKEYDSIKKDLDKLGLGPIQVRPGMNCAFEAICIQVYTPPGYNASMLRCQPFVFYGLICTCFLSTHEELFRRMEDWFYNVPGEDVHR